MLLLGITRNHTTLNVGTLEEFKAFLKKHLPKDVVIFYEYQQTKNQKTLVVEVPTTNSQHENYQVLNFWGAFSHNIFSDELITDGGNEVNQRKRLFSYITPIRSTDNDQRYEMKVILNLQDELTLDEIKI